MKINVKKLHPDAVIPSYAKPGDAGLDLVALWMKDDGHGNLEYGTGLAIEIPEGYEGQVRPRSSIRRTDLSLTNTPGTIDSSYRREIMVNFRILHDNPVKYQIGERIAQLVIQAVPHIQLVEVQELTETERGTGAYGSTGH